MRVLVCARHTPNSRRTSKTVSSSTSYLYDVNRSLPVLLDDETRKYVWGLGLAYAVDTSGALQVYHTDGLGPVRAITDDGAGVVQTYQTDEFGVPTQTQGSSTNPFQYTGEQRDAESGFVYLRARVYDPVIGRFLQRDPFAGVIGSPLSLHRYAYAQNSPVNLLDPSGLYQYRYEWYLGRADRIGSPESVMAYFQKHPREIFPFDLGQCDTIQRHAICDLKPIPTSDRIAPVEISDISPTSFTFTAKPGHFDAAGTITFMVFQREGRIYLAQKAQALVDNNLFYDAFAPVVAWFTWSHQADRLRRALDPDFWNAYWEFAQHARPW